MGFIGTIIAGIVSLIVLISFFVLCFNVSKISENIVRLRKYEQVKLIEAGLYDLSDCSFTKVVFNEDGTITPKKPASTSAAP